MRKTVKSIAMCICSMIMAVTIVFGFATLGKTAKADEGLAVTTVTLVDGASLKVDAEDPALIFTANVQNLDAEATYGVLVVEHSILENNAITEDYFTNLDELGLAYEKIVCEPIPTSDAHKIKAYFSVEEADFDVEYAAIAFVEKAGAYTYTELTENNVRSVNYVAKMALDSETLKHVDEKVVRAWVEAVEGDDYFDGQNATYHPNNTVVGIDVDKMNCPGDSGAEYPTFISNTYYAGGSVVEFDVLVSEEALAYFESQGKTFGDIWISICWTDNLNATDMYAHAHGLGVDVRNQITPGEWSHVSAVLPGESNLYVYISAAKGEWGGNLLYVDNFKVTEEGLEYLEDLEGDLEWVNLYGNPNRPEGAVAVEDIVKFVNMPFGSAEDPDMPIEPGEYALKYTFNVGLDEKIPFITTETFPAGSRVEFKYYLPAGTERGDGWWIWAWTNDINSVPYYAQLETPATGAYLPEPVVGDWAKITVQLPTDGGPYHIYLASSVGGWMNNGENSYILIDDVTVDGELVEDFNNGLKNSNVKVMNGDCVELSDEGYVPEDVDGEFAMKIVATSKNGYIPVATKEAIPGGSTVTFKYFIPVGTTTQWWRTGYKSTTPDYEANVDYYDAPYVYNTQVVGVWTEQSLTLPTDAESYYIFFVTEDGGWSATYGDPYILIDDFAVNGEVVEDFNTGLEKSIFETRTSGVELGDGYVTSEPEPDPEPDPEPEFPGEYSMKYIFNGFGDVTPAMVTKEAYAGGSEVSFKYFVPEGTIASWWGLAYSTTTDGLSIYDAADRSMAHVIEASQTAMGIWVEVKFTLPEEGPYYLYFGGEISATNWRFEDGTPSYVLIDNLTIGSVTETFNNGLEDSIFNVNWDTAVELGDGYVEPTFEPGEYAMSYICNVSSETVSQVTKEAYAAGSKVSFMYYIPEGTVTSWWGIAWSTGNTGLDIYATAGSSTGYQPGAVVGAWTKGEFTLPQDGGPYYLYFGAEVGGAHGRWMKDGENATILIDNFTVNGELVADFNNGLKDSGFEVLVDGTVALGEGYVYVAPEIPEDSAAKITIDLISGTASTPSFITKEKYVSDGTLVVTFDYYMSGNLGNKWWAFLWTNDNTQASIYAHVEDNKENNNGIDLPVNVQDQWAKASVTIPAGEWYLYFGGSVGDWGRKDGEEGRGYVIIDNFKIGNLATEDFNNTNNLEDASDYGIFVDNRSSKPNAITLVEGKPADAEDPTPDPEPDPTPDPIEPGEYAAKIFIDKIKPDAGIATFVTKEKYSAGTEISFMYYIPADVTCNWFAVLCIDTQEQADVYNDWLWQGNLIKGAWVEFKATLTKDGYIAIAGSVGDWGAKDDPKTEGYVLIDNFTIGGEVDSFNNGLTANLFDVNIDTAVVLGDGYVEEPFEPGEYAMKYIFNASGETVSQITKEAIAGGSTVSFKYYIPAGTPTSWWGLAYKDTKDGISIYDAAGANKYALGATTGTWLTAEFTLPAGGPYYLYFGSEVSTTNWKIDGENSYALIDNFTVNGELVDDFNNGLEESVFEVLVDGTVALGDGYVAEEPDPTPDPEPDPTPDPEPDPTPDPEPDPTPDPEVEGYLVVDFKAFEEGRINLHTKQAYTNITEFYVDIYVPRVDTFDWYGFTPASTVSDVDAYYAACTSNVGLKTSMGYYGWYDQWVTVKYVVEDGIWKPYLIMKDGTTKHKDTWDTDLSGEEYVADGASYIILSANPGRSYEWGMWIDNVRIVADGVTYEDNFDGGESTLFEYSSAVTVQ